jgi:2-methylisocitrate lyase-like PEP mutase family enzyme
MSVRKRFRKLIADPKMVLAPGAYDALSAKIIEAQGFEAMVAGGYAAMGALLAAPDTGQSNMRDYASHYGRICGAVNIPVYVDADTGFGGVNNVREMVKAFEAAGVAGLFISDQVFPNRCGYMAGKQVIPVEEMLAKLKAALDARKDPDLVIVARSDAIGVEGLDAGIERCQMYMELGVDMAKPMGADNIEQFKRVLREVPCPQLANLSHANANWKMSLDELEEAGAALVTFPSATLFAAVGAVTRTLQALKRDRSFEAVKDELSPLNDYYELVGLDRQTATEESYLAAAKDIVERFRHKKS